MPYMDTKKRQFWPGIARMAMFCSCVSSLLSPQCLVAGPPPNITVQPLDQAVPIGGTATFKVEASSTTTMTYQWNNKVLNLNVPIIGANSNVFIIPTISTAAVGTYNVSVINAYGVKTSSDAALTIINGAPVVNNDAYTTPKNVSITNGVAPVATTASLISSTFRAASVVTSTVDSATVSNPSSVLSNDTDVNGDVLTASLVSGVSNGQLTFFANGTFNYFPNTNFVGSDSFTYVARDSSTNSAIATVNITVTDNTSPLLAATAETLAASNLLTISATLNAAVNPQGSVVSCYFQYGTTTNYGLVTSPQTLSAGTNSVYYTDNISGLTLGTDYHYSVVVNGPGGMTVGNDMILTTPPFDVTTIAIRTNGFGNISPALDGSLLMIGRSYSVTASPTATGVAFTGWQDSTGNLVSTNLVLTFIMVSNLNYTANFVDTVRPSLSITNVPSGYTVSNNLYVVKGSANDNLLLGNVFYNLNKTGWLPAASGNIWNSWAASLNLNVGTNIFSACALDVSGNYSATNTVTINYTPMSVLTVGTNGLGSVNPALNGNSLRLGQNYTLTAVPAAGYSFSNWKDGNGLIITNKATLTFAMVPNLTLTATFVDTSKPTLILTTPTANLSTTNEFVLASGKVTDNGPVVDVLYKLNSSDWYEASSQNNWTNWSVVLDLAPGTNILSVFALDAAGNRSATNSVKFFYTTIPTTLTGLKALLTPIAAGIGQVEMAFSAATFSQIAHDTNSFTSVGSYSYTKLSPNSATLKLTYTAPPRSTNSGGQTLTLNFGALNIASYANNDSGASGQMQFAPAPTLVPASLANQSVIFVGSDGQATSNSYTSSTYVSIDLQTRSTNKGTSYTYATYSPVAALLKEIDTNGLTYKVANFEGTNYGTSYSESYTKTGAFSGASLKFFGLTSQRAGGNGPTNLYNRSVTFDSVGSRFWLSLASNTFAQFSPTPNFDSGVGSYTYGPVNTNVANLTLNYERPSEVAGNTGNVKLQFFAPNLAIFTNADKTVGHATLGNSDKLSPASLAGTSINTTNQTGANVNQIIFNADNTFQIIGFLNVAGTYEYSTFSPENGMVQLTFTSGNLAGDNGTLQLDYDTPFAGKYRLSVFDNTNTLMGNSTGSFGPQ